MYNKTVFELFFPNKIMFLKENSSIKFLGKKMDEESSKKSKLIKVLGKNG